MSNEISIASHFTNSEREALIRLCEQRRTVAKLLWSEPSDIREQSRLEDALEQLLKLIEFDGGAT
jgi:hypothetical protein